MSEKMSSDKWATPPCVCVCLQTPLHCASLENKHKFAAMLMEYGADVNMEDASRETALSLAAHNRSDDCLRIIRNHIG